MSCDLRLVPLHSRPEFIQRCVDIVNEESPDGKAHRLHDLESASCTGMPCTLVMLRMNPDRSEQVLGTSRIVLVTDPANGVYIEDVYVVQELRGQGFGKQLMLKTEEYCKNRGLQYSTIGTTPSTAKMFKKSGYRFCDWRIVTIGSGHLDITTPLPLDQPSAPWECYYRRPYTPPPTSSTETTGELSTNDNNGNEADPPTSSTETTGELSTNDNIGDEADPPVWCFEHFDPTNWCYLKKDLNN